MNNSEIIREIDKTLDQLIKNAEAISSTNMHELSSLEVEAFQKTQESLLQKFLRISGSAKSDQTLEKKKLHFQQLSSAYTQRLKENGTKRRIVLKRQKKSRLETIAKLSALRRRHD